MEETLSLFSASDIERYINDYAIPWAINIAMAIAIYVIGRLIVGGLLSVFRKIMAKSKYDNMLVDFLESILSAILMLFVIVASLDQLGVDTTSLVAILGAAGLAIGLSLQDSLKNFAAGVMLLVFKPFKAGDFVEAAGTAGSIGKIGIFTTTMNTPDNKEIIVPNGKIYSDNITNYSARDTRRVDMVVGIGYDADLLKAKRILQELVAEDERILPDPAPKIAVSELADSSVNFIVRPWVNSADFWGVKFDFTEKVKLRFDEEGISIPFPQMDVHLHKVEGE
ncbi:mechanosensitive ion channel protein [Alteromonas sp. KUL42]|uniref:mechanosensitive ion channel family protein n=1 Tax=Alteromonas sp. KUL42 TaxID=2480797 RepID=UPI000798312D|nr:mechanosensitive ion channel domain-containing protein [Alteromonas sp. KUL42]KXJ61169.1 MAG: mechanosensitive ion channel protein MscS [Alteromonas sp. Nap_26]TAP38176.1 mechanosensitive ion channel [Alteromonas sp. KUL42]GEA05395.1 mechanosensitive ion channel protein [Alteromonas sp. KUL42]